MNILYLTNHLNIGGITSYVLLLAKGLKEKGHKLYLASSGGGLVHRFIGEGVVCFPIPIKTKSEISPKIVISLFKLLKFVKTNDIQIIHSHTRVTAVLGCLLSRLSHRPHIVTCHGFFKPRLSRRLFPCWGDKVIAISEAVQMHLVEDFEVNPDNIRVIHNGVQLKNSADLRPAAKADFGLNGEPVIGIIARLSDVKGHIYLIEAMKAVLEKYPRAQLVIVGDGKMKEKLLNLARRLKIEDSVLFVPSVDDTSRILPLMDLFVMPSLKEGLGLGLLEAMAQGRAVIGSDVGGIRNLIRHGQNGLLVPPADAVGIAGAILELIEDPGKREALGCRAKAFIAENFSAAKMIEQTEEVYRECLG